MRIPLTTRPVATGHQEHARLGSGGPSSVPMDGNSPDSARAGEGRFDRHVVTEAEECVLRPDMGPEPGRASGPVHGGGESSAPSGRRQSEGMRTRAGDRSTLAPDLELLEHSVLRRPPPPCGEDGPQRGRTAREGERLGPKPEIRGRRHAFPHPCDVLRLHVPWTAPLALQEIPIAPPRLGGANRIEDPGPESEGRFAPEDSALERDRRHSRAGNRGRKRPVLVSYSSYSFPSRSEARNIRSSTSALERARRTMSTTGNHSTQLRNARLIPRLRRMFAVYIGWRIREYGPTRTTA